MAFMCASYYNVFVKVCFERRIMTGLIIVLALFAAAIVICIATGTTLIYAMAVSVIGFAALAKSRGHSFKDIWEMAKPRLKEVWLILTIFFFIGILTALWRSSGTISFFVYYCVKVTPPAVFILTAFLLPAILSYAIGTSFGVTATAGVILISIARLGGVSQVLTAGAIISGAYFGDRCSPASSCASLVAAVTGTELYSNLKTVRKATVLPLILTILFYGVLSLFDPLSQVDPHLLSTLKDSYNMSLLVILPAAFMIILPLLKVPVKKAMAVSAVVAFLITVFLQKYGFLETLKACVLGYAPENADLAAILNGGGIISMAEPAAVVTLTGITTGILGGTGILVPLQRKVASLSDKAGIFTATCAVSAAASVTLCNQTVSVMMCKALMGDVYDEKASGKEELAQDIYNSGVMIPVLVPWNIAGAIPLAMLGVGKIALLFAFHVYAVPICYGIFKKKILRIGEVIK